MKLENVVPWGRNLQEYREMFLYSDADRYKKILGCGDGPSSVNFELAKEGLHVTSIDPIYQFSTMQIKRRIEQTSLVVSEQLKKNQDDFIWKNIQNVDKLIQQRLNAMDKFLNDFETGKKEGRYIYQELPELSFEDDSFDLAWSSHFLFLYSEHFDFEFHKRSILEMLRVAKEVRIFPLLDLKNEKSLHLKPILKLLDKLGYRYEILKSDYEFQREANEVLKIYR